MQIMLRIRSAPKFRALEYFPLNFVYESGASAKEFAAAPLLNRGKQDHSGEYAVAVRVSPVPIRGKRSSLNEKRAPRGVPRAVTRPP